MTFKKISAFLLALMLFASCFGGLSIQAFAAEGETEVTPEEPETEGSGWYNEEDTVFVIDTAEELAELAAMSKTNNFAGKTIKLGADIAFNPGIDSGKMLSTGAGIPLINGAVATDPIGHRDMPFAGTFDGQGHTVSGLVSKTGYDGLFAAIQDATIKNVTVARSTLRAGSGGGCSAGLVGTTFGTSTIENVRIAKDVNLWNATYQGGVVGHNQGHLTIKNTWSSAWVNPQWGSNVYVGGFVGMNANNAQTSLTLENCLYDGAMAGTAQGSSFVGGLVGATGNNPTTKITSCLVAGDMTGLVTSTGTLYIGSLIGSKSWTAAKTVVSGTYATVETYKNADGAAQTIRDDQSFAAGTVATAAKADLMGHKARTVAPNLSWNGSWVSVNGTVPQLAAFTTAIDTSWYDASETIYTLKTKAQFDGFVYLSQYNDFAGKTVLLGTDITYNEGDASTWGTTPPAIEWLPIGDGPDGFAGVFDGKGHTISGLYYKGGGYAAFVARMYGASAKLMNVRIVNSWFESDGTADSFHNGAGIVGRATNGFTVSGVYTNAYFKGVKSMGLVAFSDAGVTNISNCWNDGTMDVSAITKMGIDPGIGGMIGYAANNQTHNITNCLVTATFTGTLNDGEFLGGIFGMSAWSAKIKVTKCLVAADMSGVTGGTVGAVAGNNPGGNGSVYTNVYATSETHANLKGAGGDTIPVTVVAEADIQGIVPEGLGAEWTAREGDVPAVNTRVISDITPIYTAEDLLAFAAAANSNNFAGKTVILMNDIVLNEGDAAEWAETAPATVWNPITSEFAGTFDGAGHSISGVYIKSANDYDGMFRLPKNAKFQNLTITNSYIENTAGRAGALIGCVQGGTLTNVHVTDTTVKASNHAGGLIGYHAGGGALTVTGCSVDATVISTGNAAAGIIGYRQNAGGETFTNCTVSGTVTGIANTGGIVGLIDTAAGTKVVFNNCVVNATVSATGDAIGGIVGKNIGAVDINNCKLSKDAAVSGRDKIGGMVGYPTNTANITNAVVDGTITASANNAGGIAGAVGANVTVTGAEVSATISATTSYAAGMVGSVESGKTLTLTGCLFDGYVIGDNNVGGLVGRFLSESAGSITNCFAYGEVDCTGWGNNGQVIGHTNESIVGNNIFWLNNSLSTKPNSALSVGKSGITGVNAVAPAVYLTDSVSKDMAYAMFKAGVLPNVDAFMATEENGTFLINNKEDLFAFTLAAGGNTFAGKTVKLAGDITINEGNAADWATTAPALNWIPIGNTSAIFAGTFDGQGYTISGLYCAYPGQNSLGMFREIKGTVGNFKLVNSYLANTINSTYGYNGGIASYLNAGTIYNVYTDAIVETVGAYAGGIVGMATGNAVVTGCQFDGTLNARCYVDKVCDNQYGGVRAHARWVGGIVGHNGSNNLNINNCIYSGLIINTDNGIARTGGILGGSEKAGMAVTITGCFSIGEFRSDADSWHFSMIMDLRVDSGNTTLTNASTVFTDNYVLTQKLYTLDGTETLNADGNLTGCNSNKIDGVAPVGSTRRFTKEAMIAAIVSEKAAGTCPLDFENVWYYDNTKLPQLRWMLTAEDMIPTVAETIFVAPEKVEYYVGEELDITGMMVVDKYTDDTLVDKNLVPDEITGFNSEEAGTCTVTVIFGETTYTFDVTIKEVPTITEFVVTAPTKTEYEIGEELSLEGMVITATYSDGNVVTITDGYDYYGFDSETAGVKTVTVIYGDFTATFDVTVKEPVVITGIAITGTPKTEYLVGDALDTNGLIITVTYSDETTVELTDGFEVSGFDSETAGIKTITVTYEGFEAVYTVNVAEPVVETGIVVNAPEKNVYEIGEELDLTGLVVTVTKSDDTTEVITEGFTVTGFDSETAGVKTITVTYGEFTATFDVTVKEAEPEKVATGIEITTKPAKVTYTVGAAFNANGLVVSVVYDDESTEVLAEGYELSGFDSATAGVKTITVTYGEFTATFEVEVVLNISVTLTAENAETGVALSWPDAGADAYVIYRRVYTDNVAGEWEQIAEVTDLAYLDTKAANGTKYGYMIRAKVGDSLGAEGSEVTLVCVDAVVVIAEQGVGAIKLKWAANPYAAKYFVYRSEYKNGAWTDYTRLTVTVNTNFSDAGTNGVLYRYCVRALIGSTQYSAYTEGTQIMRLTLPALSATNQAGGIQLSWKANNAAEVYEIYRAPYNADGTPTSWKLYDTTTELSYLDTNVENGVRYRYTVRVRNGQYISSYKDSAVLIRLDRANVQSMVNNLSYLKVTWEYNAAAGKYWVYRSEQVGGTWSKWTKLTSVVNPQTYYDDYNVTAGVTYRYRITCFKGDTESAARVSDNIVRIAGTTMSATAQTGKVKFVVKANATATSYTIERREVIDAANKVYGEWEAVVVNATDLELYDTTAEAGVTYQYRANCNKKVAGVTYTGYGKAYEVTAK